MPERWKIAKRKVPQGFFAFAAGKVSSLNTTQVLSSRALQVLKEHTFHTYIQYILNTLSRQLKEVTSSFIVLRPNTWGIMGTYGWAGFEQNGWIIGGVKASGILGPAMKVSWCKWILFSLPSQLGYFVSLSNKWRLISVLTWVFQLTIKPQDWVRKNQPDWLRG